MAGWMLVAVLALTAAGPIDWSRSLARLRNLMPEAPSAAGDRPDALYPVGFSPGGRFAYILRSFCDDCPILRKLPDGRTENTGEVHDVVRFTFVVRDLATDAVEVEIREERPEPDTALAGFLDRNLAALQRHLDRLGIRPAPGLRLRTFPSEVGGERLTVRLVPPAEDDEARETRVLLRSTRAGERQVGTVAAGPHDRALRVLGFLASPHQPRIVLLCAREVAGWEGTPGNVFVALFPASLADGPAGTARKR